MTDMSEDRWRLIFTEIQLELTIASKRGSLNSAQIDCFNNVKFDIPAFSRKIFTLTLPTEKLI